VEALVAAQDGQRAGVGQCVDVEQRRDHLRAPETSSASLRTSVR
jgi:hypothetical protein